MASSGYPPTVYADDLLWPWAEALLREHPGLRLFDAHTHVGANDPSGFSATVADVLSALSRVDARAAVFPLTEPSGYREANDAVLAAAEAHEQLVAFCRLRPDDGVLGEARRCARAGVRGIKLHPASDEFSITNPRLPEVFALAEQERLPVLVHAGPENEPLGEALIGLFADFPGLRVVLAHAGLTDLAWLGERAADFPHLFFDTSWWSATDLLTAFVKVPPGQVLLGSDVPYSTPVWATHATLRCAAFVGLTDDQVTSVMGEQFRRLVEGEDTIDVGGAPGGPGPLDPLLERLYVYLCAGVEATKRGESPGQTLASARHSCRVAPDHPDAAVFDSVLHLLDRYEKHAAERETGNEYAPGWDLVATAAVVARTPGPRLPDLSPPHDRR